MTAYRDQPQWQRDGELCGHLIADGIEELHAVAERIGLTRKQFNGTAINPYYTLPARLLEAADQDGVIACSGPQFLHHLARIERAGAPPARHRVQTGHPSKRRTSECVQQRLL